VTSPATIWDTVALLTLFDTVNKVSRVYGNLKAQKLAFLAELAAEHENVRVLHYRFFRYTFGPYSGQLATWIERLEKKDILTSGRLLTKRGRYVLDYAAEAVSESTRATTALDVMRETAKKFGRRSGVALKDYVYGLTVPVLDLNGETRRVRDIPLGLDIIDPSRDPNLAEVSPFDGDALEELSAELAMNHELLRPDSHAYKRTVSESLRRALASQ
jgi:hypothetical protein